MKLALSLAALLLATTAQAQVTGTTNSEANANTTSAATNAGNAQQMGMTMISNASGTIRNVPSLGGSAYGVSYSPKNCNSTVGVTGVGPGAGASIATATENEVCEDLLKADTLMMMSVNAHNIGAATLAKDPTSSLGMGYVDEGARLRSAAYDTICSTSIRTHKIMMAHDLCTPISALLFAAGATDPDQPRNEYKP